MKQCPIIQDLLPLYVDEALSPESRALVEEHLSTCDACRRTLADLRTGAPTLPAMGAEGAAPSEDARFLHRLKRQAGTVIGLGLLLLVLTAFGANQYGHWRADKEYGQKMQAQMQEEQAAIEAIRQASPDPMARLKERGVDITHTVSQQGRTLRVNYLVHTPPDQQANPLHSMVDPRPRLYDPATGKGLGNYTGGSHSMQLGHPTEGRLEFVETPTGPIQAEAQLPYLLLYQKPDQELRWDVTRPGERGDVRIGQRFTTAGAEFEVERIRFDGSRVQIDYRQLTDPTKVGLHFLTFRLSDRMGSNWGADYNLDRLPDPLRPSHVFEPVASLSKNWSVQVEHVVLALPGPSIPIQTK